MYLQTTKNHFTHNAHGWATATAVPKCTQISPCYTGALKSMTKQMHNEEYVA